MARWSSVCPPAGGHVLVMLNQGFYPGDRNERVGNILSVSAHLKLTRSLPNYLVDRGGLTMSLTEVTF